MKRLAVLASGTGSNLEAIIKADLPVELVVTDRECNAIKVAQSHGISCFLIDRHEYGYGSGTDWDRAGFTGAISRSLVSSRIDLVVMAGFMSILAPAIFSQFEDRILNTHPSLLPKFKGARAIQQALAAGVTETGVTVHIATRALDSGRVLAQAAVPVMPGDTEATLQERIKIVEHQLYPRTIEKYMGASVI